MKKNIKLCFKGMMTLILVGWSCIAAANLYRITGVAVSAEGSSALVAKEQALIQGEVDAFTRLLVRLVGEEALTQLPTINEEVVLPYVQGVSIENEKTTATRYMGTIAVEFAPEAVRQLLANNNVPYLKDLPPSVLIVPRYISGYTDLALDEENPLYQALKTEDKIAPFYRADVPMGDINEMSFVNEAFANERPEDLKELLSQYGKDRIMVLRMVRENEDIWLMDTTFYPKTSMENQSVYKRFKVNSADQKETAKQMVRAVFNDMENKWRQEKTDNFDDNHVLYLRIPVSSLAEWRGIEKQIKGWSFWENVTVRGLYLPQVLVEVTYTEDEAILREQLDKEGWILNKDSFGNGASLTRKELYE